MERRFYCTKTGFEYRLFCFKISRSIDVLQKNDILIQVFGTCMAGWFVWPGASLATQPYKSFKFFEFANYHA